MELPVTAVVAGRPRTDADNALLRVDSTHHRVEVVPTGVRRRGRRDDGPHHRTTEVAATVREDEGWTIGLRGGGRPSQAKRGSSEQSRQHTHLHDDLLDCSRPTLNPLARPGHYAILTSGERSSDRPA